MISSLAWVPKGRAKAVPDRHEVTEAELEALRAHAADAGEEDDEGADESGEGSEGGSSDGSGADGGAGGGGGGSSGRKGVDKDGLPLALDMSNYDDEEADVPGIPMFEGGMKGALYHQPPKGDAFVTLPDAVDEEDPEDEEDFVLKPGDALLVTAKTEEDYSCLEVRCGTAAGGGGGVRAGWG